MDSRNSFLTTPVAILLSSFVISVAILLHGGVIKLNNSVQPLAAQPAVPAGQQPQASAAPTSAQVSVDDDPVLGDKNAPITLIEFSDYECPFCKRHFDQVYPELKKNYIDTGKVKLVFRDYPLSFHDPMATFEANAANCAKDQGGDSAYFKFHDAIFAKTTSNGSGLTKDQVYQLAQEAGVNQDELKKCADDGKFNDEVKKDFDDGSKAGVTGTPSFFVGKSDSSGTITGKKIEGAQPYSAFQTAIDAALQ